MADWLDQPGRCAHFPDKAGLTELDAVANVVFRFQRAFIDMTCLADELDAATAGN